jgi:hypothetical protein
MQIREIAHVKPRCDIAWLHVTNHLYNGFQSYTFKQSPSLRSIV